MWMTQAEDKWPIEQRHDDFTPEQLEQKREIEVLHTNVDDGGELIDLARFSSASRVDRVTAWVLRFVNNLRGEVKRAGPLTAAEIGHAHVLWLKKAQSSSFSVELQHTASGNKLPGNSTLKDFTLWTDDDGLLRIRGRLCSSNMTHDERHPVVLPKRHRYTVLLVQRAHQQLLHAGARDTLVQLREKYWIVRGRQLVKSVVRSCVVCRRFSATGIDAATGLLPPDRTTKADPFEVVGIDFAGPLFVKQKDVQVKSYIVLFTCAVTRAVHLELVNDMTTESFLQAFRRFVSRRGLCKIIYSDNALTFKRASRELALLWNVLRHPEALSYFANANIEWKFIVEHAPWWGGFYERLVRSVKTALKKVIGRQCLDFVELSTVLAEVEAVINSRPLTHVPDDPNDGAALTPASFLTGRRLTTLPGGETRAWESNASSLRMFWKKRKHMLHAFWQAWQHEYLLQLRSAYASKQTRTEGPKIGDVVLVRENIPRLLWKRGVICSLFPGRDGNVRSCVVRMPQGKFVRRPVQHLYPLEICEP